jgi:hypothetical protein
VVQWRILKTKYSDFTDSEKCQSKSRLMSRHMLLLDDLNEFFMILLVTREIEQSHLCVETRSVSGPTIGDGPMEGTKDYIWQYHGF